jgi:hypothetical protein
MPRLAIFQVPIYEHMKSSRDPFQRLKIYSRADIPQKKGLAFQILGLDIRGIAVLYRADLIFPLFKMSV